jgi:hypothetical protein
MVWKMNIIRTQGDPSVMPSQKNSFLSTSLNRSCWDVEMRPGVLDLHANADVHLYC